MLKQGIQKVLRSVPSNDSVIQLSGKEPADIRMAVTPGIVAHPSKSALDLMPRHMGVAEALEIPLRTTDMRFLAH